MIKLDQWAFCTGGCLYGTITGHPDFEDGDFIRTSHVVAREPKTNVVRTTSGSVYQLLEHSGRGYPEDMIWNDHGWCGGGVIKKIPRLEDLGIA